MFPSLLEEITGHGMPVECSKLTCFAKVKIRHGSRAVRSTIEVGRCQSLFAYCEAEFDLGKGKNRSKATYPHWKDENNNHHWQTNPNSHVYESESQSEVDVQWPAMYAQIQRQYIMVALQVGTRAQLICWPSDGLQLGWSTVLPLAVGSWATIQGPCAMHAQTTLVDGEASARRSKKTFGPHGRVPAYGKDSTKRRQLWGSFRRFG